MRAENLSEGSKLTTVKVQKVGNSLGVVLPKEVLAKLGVTNGDDLFLIETQAGYQLTSYDPKFAEQVSVAEGIMKTRRNMVRKLVE